MHEEVGAFVAQQGISQLIACGTLGRGLAEGARRAGMEPTRVQELPDATREKLFRAVSEFDDFTEDNDPHHEHDFGRIQLDGHTFFWKVDYFDHTLCFGADDPSDNHNTTRVLTIMLASEY